jgi:hypothetical protein
MTDDDYELLELAARAIGAVGFDVPGDEDWANLTFEDGAAAWNWNPLQYGDDALALAVGLGMDIMHRVVDGRRVEVLASGRSITTEFYDGDALAATRRAIVRAAAEIAVASQKEPA